MGLMESINTINNALRTMLATVVVGAVGVGGYFGFNKYFANELEAQRATTELAAVKGKLVESHQALAAAEQQLTEKAAEISRLEDELKELAKRLQKVEMANRLLKMQHRVARLDVIEQQSDPQTNKLATVVRFVETDDTGREIDEPRQFSITGDVVYVDNWIVKFEDKYVEQADLERATSLCLFRRLFGEEQKPMDGHSLLKEGALPRSYARGGEVSDFERKIWQDFWEIANDKSKAEQLGISAAHGEAISIKTQRGKSYRIDLRASGGLSIVPDDMPRPKAVRPAT